MRAASKNSGRFAGSDAVWGDTRLDMIGIDEVRQRIMVADNNAELFAGSLRSFIAGRDKPDDQRIRAALHTAAATDIVDGLPGGLDTAIHAHGRKLFGGQRQRLGLARAVCAAPEILLNGGTDVGGRRVHRGYDGVEIARPTARYDHCRHHNLATRPVGS